MSLANKDLNLLRIFQVLWQERNVSKAALKLGLTQPAISNALNRLRDDFGDQLFVRASKGVIPTPMATKLHAQIEKLLGEAHLLYSSEEGFNPKTSDRLIYIRSTEYFEQLFLPQLLQILEEEAPNMRIVSRSLQGDLPKREMEEGACDLAIAGYFDHLPEGFFQEVVFKDEFQCIVRKNHPLLKEKFTLKKYTEMKHVLINPSGTLEGIADRLLTEKKMKRSIGLWTSSFMAPGAVIQKTDFILTAPSRLCQHFHDLYKVEVLPSPLAMPPIKVIQIWHNKVHQDPPIKWLRGKIFEMCKKSK